MKWVVATDNKGKIAEFRAIFHGDGIELITKSEAGFYDEIEENGSTFEENALIKARAGAGATGLPTISDDSGLTVDALGGKPGICSARYAEPGHRKERVLREISEVPDGERGAAFYCAIACVIPGVIEFTVSGECRGYLTRECHGTNGFGYDPIFYIPEYGKTFGELPPEVKNKISHRAIALAKLREKLIEMELLNADK